MDWEEFSGSLRKRFGLNDGTQVVGVIRKGDSETHIEFFGDGEELERVEATSEKLGELSDLIESLQPQDVIDICRRMEKK